MQRRSIYRTIQTAAVAMGCLFAAASLGCSSQPAAAPAALAFYTVDHYDEARDPAADLAATVERARAEQKHILIQVGGDWCSWCHLMSKFIESNEAVRAALEKDYLLMKLADGSNDPNAEFLADYPEIPGHPHLYVLDSEGELLHSQPTKALEEGGGYDEALYLKFLDQWKPESAL